MTTEPTNTDDMIDSRDVISRIDELEDLLPDMGAGDAADAREEYDTLKSLANEAEGSPDWQYGEGLIRYSYFKEYARDLAEDCGMIPTDLGWPCTCIDWDQACRELKMDYISVDFDGVEYWIRA